jgi:hypothetical protein
MKRFTFGCSFPSGGMVFGDAPGVTPNGHGHHFASGPHRFSAATIANGVVLVEADVEQLLC